MLIYKPAVVDFEDYSEQIDYTSSEDSILAGYNAFENDENKGTCVFSIDKQNCTILYLYTVDNDNLLCEGLIRSSLNYSANRGAYMAYCKDCNYESVLKLLGFNNESGTWQGDIPTLLQGSCCKKQ